ncbi:hypothetical protein MMC30_007147 [Trapelia coarctata]|nr:hypothetical protein [Trapelia coarctata]
MHWSSPIAVALLVAATPALSYHSHQQLYDREAELGNLDPRSNLYARGLNEFLYARDADFDFDIVKRFAEALPEPGVTKPKPKPARKTKSSISKDVKAKAQASTSGAQPSTSREHTYPPPPPIPHDTRPQNRPEHVSRPGTPTEGLPLHNGPEPKEPWYKTKKGATTAGFGAASGVLGIAASQVGAPYNHALAAASGAAGLAGAATHFLPGKRALDIIKRRNAIEMLHVRRSLEMLEQRDEHLDGLLARHEIIEERNASWEGDF